ncbi:MAG: transposase [Synechococcus sp. SB0673_bin_10]|nr:transposase [Cyanobacteria bacterium MAG IRC1_bin_28]MXX08424.1 transposase [Synechococcus sp. SB0667_bin_8]MYG64967.1 transposase [Synechococcus sp. SB0675_bin_7]MYI72511.1 transposase [Synechococcus sp. SB0673_bin_10]MYK85624.1 transposase [Synechococcus sp. SB0669_bin_7]
MAKAHATRADKRSDHLHKLSTRLIRENQTVVLEDLNVSGMVKNRKMGPCYCRCWVATAQDSAGVQGPDV